MNSDVHVGMHYAKKIVEKGPAHGRLKQFVVELWSIDLHCTCNSLAVGRFTYELEKMMKPRFC